MKGLIPGTQGKAKDLISVKCASIKSVYSIRVHTTRLLSPKLL